MHFINGFGVDIQQKALVGLGTTSNMKQIILKFILHIFVFLQKDLSLLDTAST